MAKKESSAKPNKVNEVIGYPDKPMPIKYIVAAVAAWAVWICFLLAMAYIRRSEWPFYPT